MFLTWLFFSLVRALMLRQYWEKLQYYHFIIRITLVFFLGRSVASNC